MVHLDLFSGIGGFAYAADQVWEDVEHIFCEIDPFCQQVLKKHWPEATVYEDIRDITDTERRRLSVPRTSRGRWHGLKNGFDLLTGGFPCQPFSAAGLRRGTADERHLWPEMLRVIRLTTPQWVIAENVRGITNWNAGVVFEQVCTDLEAAGYEVQPFIIPAVAVNAPHRRDRVWFVARYAKSERGTASVGTVRKGQGSNSHRSNGNATNTASIGQPARGSQGQSHPATKREQGQHQDKRFNIPDWGRNWTEVAAELCSVDDGLPAELGEFKLSKSAHRKEQLKAYGNAIVPQVAVEIMRGMQSTI